MGSLVHYARLIKELVILRVYANSQLIYISQYHHRMCNTTIELLQTNFMNTPGLQKAKKKSEKNK